MNHATLFVCVHRSSVALRQDILLSSPTEQILTSRETNLRMSNPPLFSFFIWRAREDRQPAIDLAPSQSHSTQRRRRLGKLRRREWPTVPPIALPRSGPVSRDIKRDAEDGTGWN